MVLLWVKVDGSQGAGELEPSTLGGQAVEAAADKDMVTIILMEAQRQLTLAVVEGVVPMVVMVALE